MASSHVAVAGGQCESSCRGPDDVSSCIYVGRVRHRRFGEFAREFEYRLSMLYLDLDEVETLFDSHWLWSVERSNVASFHREDHVGDPRDRLTDTIRRLVGDQLGRTPEGPIRLLTQPRYFGYVMNPISLYYCFDAGGQQLDAIVAEVTNTPWGERCCYVIDAVNGQERAAPGSDRTQPIHATNRKQMHVSPFLPMNMRYEWRLTAPGDRLGVQIDDFEDSDQRLQATLNLERRPLNSRTLMGALIRYPAMTFKVTAAIYWQAFRLWWIGVPFVPHPDRAAGQAGG